MNISVITKYEILAGLEYKQAQRQLQEFESFLTACRVLNVNDESVRISARIYGSLRRKGITIGTADLLITGIALHHNLQLITNNVKHYQDIEGLELADWKSL